MQKTALPQELTPSVVAQLIQVEPAIRILDVRTPGEFASSHIRGAYNVPLDTLGEHANEISMVAGVPFILVCQSGGRARKAEGNLKAAGMDSLHVLDGGMNAWLTSGLPVMRGAKRVSLERQVRIVAGSLAAIGGILALAVNPLFAAIPALIGSGLTFAGVTDTCAMGMLLARLKYNRASACDPAAVVRALKAGREVPVDQIAGSQGQAAACCSN